ncbi:hypothetical protein ABZW30_38970 [Kitasatospora sp. NPDC004669]
MADPTANAEAQMLELEDIQGTLLRQRPSRYTGAYFLSALRRLPPRWH